MLKLYGIHNGKFCEGDGEHCNVLVFTDPTDEEKKHLINDLKIDEHTLNSAMDPDELSRLEHEPDHIAMIIKRPRNYSAADQFVFRVSSVGLFLFADKLVVVGHEELLALEGRHFHKIASLPDLLLKILYRISMHFTEHLKIITMITDEVEGKIATAMENRYLLNLFSLEKGITFYHNSIHSNGVVIEKLKTNAAKIGFTPENVEFIDDLTIENNQSLKQAEIYSNIFASLMDARASIVNNNLSVLIKRLTIINVVFLPLNFLAGMGGMSEYSMITAGVPWWVAYPSFFGAMLVIASITYFIIRRLSREVKARKRGKLGR